MATQVYRNNKHVKCLYMPTQQRAQQHMNVLSGWPRITLKSPTRERERENTWMSEVGIKAQDLLQAEKPFLNFQKPKIRAAVCKGLR